jgi:copper chaperone CopZ
MVKRFMVFGLLAIFLLAVAGVVYSENETEQTQAEVKTAKCGMSAEECAKLCGMTPEEFNQLCPHQENCGVVKLSVEGMTCGGCEQTVSAALEKAPGVYKVVKVDYKEGLALVCVNQKESSDETLAKAVTDTGYKAEVVPAVATTTEADNQVPAGCPPTCPAAKKGCAGKK